MSNGPTQTEIDAAAAYEDLFVEALFGEWAPRVLDAAQAQPDERVLDVACGTGVLAREAAVRVGQPGSVTGLDAGAGMLAVAERIEPGIEWRQGKAEELPFADESFDVVVSQFGLMFFSDRQQALREMWRVLKPQGRLGVAVWDTLENNPSYAVDVALLDRFGGRRAGDALRAPFVLGNRAELAALFAAAGMSSASIATSKGTGRFPSIRVMIEADLRGWLPVMGVYLTEPQIAQILRQAEEDFSRYLCDDGSVEFESSAHIVSVAGP